MYVKKPNVTSPSAAPIAESTPTFGPYIKAINIIAASDRLKKPGPILIGGKTAVTK